MSKNLKHINHHEEELTLTALTEAAKRMKGPNQALTLIEELLTQSERITLGRRILIAQMILAGKSQSEVRSKLGVSPNTFTRSRKWLQRQIPNYADALKESMMHENDRADKRAAKKNRREQLSPAHTFAGMRKRYPMHFLLFNIAEELFTTKK